MAVSFFFLRYANLIKFCEGKKGGGDDRTLMNPNYSFSD